MTVAVAARRPPRGHVTVAVLRAVPRAPIVVAVGTAFAAVGVLGEVAGQDGAFVALQVSVVALACAAVTLLDEPPLPALPISLPRRRVRSLGVGLPLLALAWLALLALANVDGADARLLTLHLAAVVALSMATGSVVGVALAYCVARVFFGSQLFSAGSGWWAGAACAGLLGLAASSRD